MSSSTTYDAASAVSLIETSHSGLLNIVEPQQLVDAFMAFPPVGFESVWLRSSSGLSPAFRAKFDLLTTLDGEAQKVANFLKRIPFVKQLLSMPTIFVGTTATEYANYHDSTDYRGLIDSLLFQMRQRKAELLVVKDIPHASPLLSEHEHAQSELLLQQCSDRGFIPMSGQALAYVPIDFSSVDEFLQRMSKSRRKEFRKKLKDSANVCMDELPCGSSEFFDEALLDELFAMYINVYAQSELQFDQLTKSFFRAMLQDASNGGKVFCYRLAGRLIGYNICFVHGKRLVDKYVGFHYPEARAANLYFISWFYNLEYALKHNLDCYIAGWTDPAVKKALGAQFTLTRHLVYIRNPILRAILKPLKPFFESDSNWIENQETRSLTHA